MVRVALVTTTRGSSEYRPDGEAEATSRVVAEPQKAVTFPAHSGRCHIRQDLSSCGSEPRSNEKKAGVVPALTYLPWPTRQAEPTCVAIRAWAGVLV